MKKLPKAKAKKGKNDYNVGTQTIIQKGDGYRSKKKPPIEWWTKNIKKRK